MDIASILLAPAVTGNVILNLLGGFASSYGLTMTVPAVPLAPPKIVFPIAWTILYVLLGIVAGNLPTQLTAFLYYTHLGLNFIWSTVYFGLEWKELSLAIILCMLAITIALIVLLRGFNIDWFLYPYLIWLIYAMYLNASSL